MYEILKNGLFLSSFADLEKSPEGRNFFIVNVSHDLPMLGENGIQIPMDDAYSENNKMYNVFPHIVKIIQEKLKSGIQVVVHCYAGQQRSAAVIAALLLCCTKWEVDKTIEYIRQCKPDAFYGRITFERALKKWHKNLRQQTCDSCLSQIKQMDIN
uniref:Tyrosine specific protein phosphatases domain-containing protein n=1 Tax=viral metagenome TaxID=1070528 RepID=A0A6C0CQK4_9ZZZZ